MASSIDPSVIVDGANVAKSALRNQLSIARDEISALQAAGPGEAGTIAVSNDPPTSPAQGRLWIDTNTPSATVWTLNIWSGTAWVALGRVDTATQRLVLIDGGTYTFATLSMQRQGGTKGGAVLLQAPTSGTSLVGDNVITEVDGSFVKIYESGGTTRGVQVDLTTGLTGGSSNLWHEGQHGVVEATLAYSDVAVDLPVAPTWHTFGEVVLPDNITSITVTGRVNSLMAAGAGGDSTAIMRLQLVNSGGTEITVEELGRWAALRGADRYYPISARLPSIAPASGLRLRVQGQKLDPFGRLDVFNIRAFGTGLRSL